MNVVSYLAFAHVFGRLLKVPTMTIQLFPSSSGSGLSTLLFCAVMLISPVSALLPWDFVCNFRAIKRHNWAHKGPLYGYTCVRCWYTKGLHAAIDGLLIYVACCLCCLVVLLCCAGLSDRMFRCSGCDTCSPGVSRGCPGKRLILASLADAGVAYRTAPHHTTPHHTTPHRTVPPPCITPHHATPHHHTSHHHHTAHHTTHHTTPCHTPHSAPHNTPHTTPHRTTQHITSHHTTPHHTTHTHHNTHHRTSPQPSTQVRSVTRRGEISNSPRRDQ